MNRIDRIFSDLRAGHRKALMPFLCAGYPSLDSTAAALPALEKAGASIVELGIPFSDPIADGPVIAAAMHEALQRKVTPRSVFETVARARASTNLGLVAMVSYSIVHRLGVKAFAKDAAAAGFDGVILPDLPLEEADRAIPTLREAGLTATLLIAPTTPPERMARIANLCSGFIYLLARMGITGATPTPQSSSSSFSSPQDPRPKTQDPSPAPSLPDRIRQLRSMTDLPIACGFGISAADHVRAVVSKSQGNADAAIVGSALVSRMGQAKDPVAEAAALVTELCQGLIN